MRNILTILGARPQFVKAAALSRALKQDNSFQELIIHTGQHFDRNMSEIFFNEMQIPRPDYNLSISGLNHGAMTGRMMEGIEEIVLDTSPDAILVFGDTNSTLAGALVGSKLHIPVFHVEAGLRSFNMEMPEEVNRILTDRVSNLLLCPTDNAIMNLQHEGFQNFEVQIDLVGDVMQDAANFYSKYSGERSTVIEDNGLSPDDYVILTCHRAENTDDIERLNQIINGINQISHNKKVIWPVHPRLASRIEQLNISENVICIDPVGYFDMIELLKYCYLVITDSGGLQKESYFFKKACITIRDQTEWTELVDNGFNHIVGASSHRIQEAFKNAYKADLDWNVQLYGDGKASENIVSSMKDFFQR